MADSSNSTTDDGGNTINNLFSELMQILVLFGESFAKQFLSESTSLWDCIVFACAPLGIGTAIDGCIRVGGPTWLRAVIGRARENRAAAEIEFMSSTSNEVGESFNGQSIVRTLGKPQITQLIYVEEHNDGKHRDTDGSDTENANSNESNELSPRTKPPQERLNYEAPNTSLNIHGGSKKIDLILASLCGLLLQFGMVVFSGFTVYHPLFKSRFKKNGKDVAVYAYPTMAAGTVILFTGLLVCCIVIDRSTKEIRWVLKSDDVGSNGQPTAKKSKKNLRIFWLQKSHTTSDQEFDSFVLFAPDPTTEILTSRRLENDLFETLKRKITGPPFLATFGTVLASSGYLIQSQGLRGLHWSSSIAQLVAVFFMTLIRAWVRRELVKQP
ncbi:hypothetical protein FPQ18DRAFT_261562, partial [Pyronema domesticum]